MGFTWLSLMEYTIYETASPFGRIIGSIVVSEFESEASFASAVSSNVP